MNALSIFTRTRNGLDNRVWLTMLVSAILFAGLLGFKMATNVPCGDVEIKVEGYSSGKANSYYLGEKIFFTAEMKHQKDVVWDFGDHTDDVTGHRVTHAYTSEGNYAVTATVNGKCVETALIHIRQLTLAPVIAAGAGNGTENPISGLDAPYAGTPVAYTATRGASFEWTVLNAPDFPVQHGAVANFIFPVAGTRVIELKLNNDPAKVYRKQIQVLPSAQASVPAGGAAAPLPANPFPAAPPMRTEPAGGNNPQGKAPADAPKIMIIPDEEFRNMLTQVTEGGKDLQSFNEFLCNGAQTKVLLNGDEWKTLNDFFEMIYKKKKYIIKSVETVRNDKNCVTLLKVNYKKKGLLGL